MEIKNLIHLLMYLDRKRIKKLTISISNRTRYTSRLKIIRVQILLMDDQKLGSFKLIKPYQEKFINLI
jgi:hypothetical protein